MAMPMSRALANGSSSGNCAIIGWARLTHSTADGTLLTKCKAETVCISRQGGFLYRQTQPTWVGIHEGVHTGVLSST